MRQYYHRLGAALSLTSALVDILPRMSVLPADFCINSRWILPMTVRDELLVGHSIMISDGRILDILPRADALQRYNPAHTIDRPTHVLIPGLVGARTDALWAPPPDAAALAALLRGGVTCFNSMSRDPAATARLAMEQGLRTVLGLNIASEARVQRTPAEQITAALRIRDEYQTHPLISTAFAPDIAADLDDAVMERIATLANELDSPLLLSLHASASEIAACLAMHGKRPIERLHHLGLLTPSLNAAHMTHANSQDLDIALQGGISITLCPSADLERNAGLAPVAEFMAQQCRLGLGGVLDAADAGWDPWFDIKLIDLRQPAVDATTGVGVWDCLAAATIGGAAALGLDSVTGSLQAGKWADLCCLDLAGPAAQALQAPLSRIVRSGGRDLVSDVWVAGRQLLHEGLFTRFQRALR